MLIAAFLAIIVGADAGLGAVTHGTAQQAWIAGLTLLLVIGIIGLIWSLRGSRGPEPVAASGAPVDDDQPDPGGTTYNVTSHNQQGGITAGVVNVFAPDPRIETTVVKENEKHNDGYHTVVRFDIQSAYAAPGIAVEALGQTITKFVLSPAGSGGTFVAFNTAQEVSPERGVMRIGAPLSATAYEALIVTDEPDQLRIHSNLQ